MNDKEIIKFRNLKNKFCILENKLKKLLDRIENCGCNSSGGNGNLTPFNLYSIISCNRGSCEFDEELYIVAYHNGVNPYADEGDTIFIDSEGTINIINSEFEGGMYEAGIAQIIDESFNPICFNVEDNTVAICTSG